jgi:hypothetical protein
MTFEFAAGLLEVCGIMSAAYLLIIYMEYDADTGIYDI